MMGVNHISMSKLNLKLKIYSELLVGDIQGRGLIILPCSGSILNSKFSVSYWLAILRVNHLSMSKLNLKYKIYSEIFVGNNGRQSSFHVQA